MPRKFYISRGAIEMYREVEEGAEDESDNMKYALRYFKDIDGKPAWFHMMTAIGPKLTTDRKEVHTFDSEQEANAHPAIYHPLCLLDAEPFNEPTTAQMAE